MAFGNANREDVITGAKGLNIFVRSWRPMVMPRGIVVICHGVNSHSGYYLWTGEELAARGLAVYAIDLHGRGQSAGERFYLDDVAEYVEDVHAVVKLAKSRDSGLPVFLLGHSAGGVVACTYALEHQEELAGLICESFAFQLPAPSFVLSAVTGLSYLAPHVKVLKLKNEDFSRDPQIVQKMNSDPLIERESQPSKTVAALARADTRLRREFGKITLPLFILHGTADKVTMPSGSRFFHANAGSVDKTLKLYEGHAHDLLNDLGREIVLSDIVKWIDQHLAGMPGQRPTIRTPDLRA